MKRSLINTLQREAIEFLIKSNYRLPPFAFWSAEEWYNKSSEYNSLRKMMLGWDITDFGSDCFYSTGAVSFRLRNKTAYNEVISKPYSEALIIIEENQRIPLHYHMDKIEDIINRSGGNLMVTLYNVMPYGELDTSNVMVIIDGCQYQASAGSTVRLAPGESITILPNVYHSYYGETGCGKLIAGLISTVGSSRMDNHFHEFFTRYPIIENDELPLYLLTSDYSKI